MLRLLKALSLSLSLSAAGCGLKKSMVMALLSFLVVLLFLGVGVSSEKIYIVGGDAGWTTLGNPMPNYTAWAVTKTFQVGDTILFRYNKQYHNVLEVSHADYSACNSTSPLTIHTTGNDSILIKSPGHHYFICGFPGHCALGQKVDINASLPPSSPPSTSPGSGNQSDSHRNYAPASAKGAVGLSLVLCVMGAISSFILP